MYNNSHSKQRISKIAFIKGLEAGVEQLGMLYYGIMGRRERADSVFCGIVHVKVLKNT